MTELEGAIELLQGRPHDRQLEVCRCLEDEGRILARVHQWERGGKVPIQHALALDVRVGHVHRTTGDGLEETARIDTERLREDEGLGEILDRAEDPAVHHELQARPQTGLAEPDVSTRNRLEDRLAQ